ncbi:MAG: hypothetical protein AB7E75_01930 [Candidatus Methanomethylophilaceae archaeon]|nr:hypothetical protein [Candidatus Methanomethylophilaceae archaeon]
MGQETTQRKGCGRLPDGPEEQIIERIAMTGGYENPVQVPPSGKGDFWFESYDPNIESFYSDNAKELICRLFLNLGAVNLVRMRGYTWSVELGDNLYGIVLTGADAQRLHSIERATAPLIQSHAREDVQDSVTPGNGGCQTLHFAISVPLRRSCRCR